MSIRAPRIQNPMHIAFINASIFKINDWRITSQVLAFIRRSETILNPHSLADNTSLHTKSKSPEFALVSLWTFWAASRWDHLGCLKYHYLLNLTIFPLSPWLVHNKVVLHKPWPQNSFFNWSKKNSFKHLRQKFIHLFLIFLEFMPLLI